MADDVIQVEHLSKLYHIGLARRHHDTLREALTGTLRGALNWRKESPSEDAEDAFWALKDVSFGVKAGEVLGVVGRNGAGKSTLLKILSRITEPTSGRARIGGRVGSLLEVGTGFHPELTGRENIYLNGAILGMHKNEIERKFDEIIAFSGIEQFLDTPVKRYSSGMYVRLAFAVAAHLEPEILLVDEVLAVGDAAFQKKCLGKMGNVAQAGRTVLFVSHNMAAMSALAEKAIYLKDGQIAGYDIASKVIEQYLWESRRETTGKERSLDRHRREFSHDAPIRTTGISINGRVSGASEELPTISMGDTVIINVQVEANRKIQDAHIDITLKNSRGERITILFSRDRGFTLNLAPGKHVITARVDGLPLAPGFYSVDIGINQSMGTKAHDVVLDYPAFRIVGHEGIKLWLDRPWGAVHCDTVKWSSLQHGGADSTGGEFDDAE